MPVERIGVITHDAVKLRDNAELRLGDGAQGGDWDVSDVKITWDGTDLDMLPTVDDTVFKIGNGTLSLDVWLYGGTATRYLFWDASASALYVSGGASIVYNDSNSIAIGNSNDALLQWDGTNLVLSAAADDTKFYIGSGGATQLSFDVIAYGSTSAGSMTWDASADTLIFDSAGVRLDDNDRLRFGDSDDIRLYFDGTDDLQISGLTTGNNVKFGDGTLGQLDVYLIGNTMGNQIQWDASTNGLLCSAGVVIYDNNKLYLGNQNDIAIGFDGTDDLLMTGLSGGAGNVKVGDGSTGQLDLLLYGSSLGVYSQWDASIGRWVFLSGGQSELKTWTTSGGALEIRYGTAGSTGYIPIYTTAA